MSNDIKPGWFDRQFATSQEEIDALPSWIKREAGISPNGGTMTPNPDELREVRAAAADVKRRAGLYDVTNIVAREAAAVKLADYILAEHPADDSLAVDEDWLRSLPYRVIDHGSKDSILFELRGGTYLVVESDMTLAIQQGMFDGRDSQYIGLPVKAETRGQFRRLVLSLSGVPLAEPAPRAESPDGTLPETQAVEWRGA